MILNDIVRQALTSGHLAHLVTLNKDGSPQVSIVWVGLDGDDIVCGHIRLHQKVQNIQRDARVALSIIAAKERSPDTDAGRFPDRIEENWPRDKECRVLYRRL